MNLNRRFLNFSAGVLAAGCVLLGAGTGEAAPIAFHVVVNTASMVGSGSAPFALDFQLTGGNPLGNTATISDVTFNGGAATNTPPATAASGLASGTLATSVTLSTNPANFVSEFYQGFTPGLSLAFNLLLTTNVNTPTPDAFSFAILDKNLQNIQTPGLGDALLLVNLSSDRPSVQRFTGVGPFSAVAVTATPVPEPASLLLIGSGLVVAAARRRRTSNVA